MRPHWVFAVSVGASACSIIDLGGLSEGNGAGGATGTTVTSSSVAATTNGPGSSSASAPRTASIASAAATTGSDASTSSGGCVSTFCDSAPPGAFCDDFDDLDAWEAIDGGNIVVTSSIDTDVFQSCPSSLRMDVGATAVTNWAQRALHLPGTPRKIGFSMVTQVESVATSSSFFELAWLTPGWYCQLFIRRDGDDTIALLHALDTANNWAGTDLASVVLDVAPSDDALTSVAFTLDLDALTLGMKVGNVEGSTAVTPQVCTMMADAGSFAVYLGTVFDSEATTLYYDDVVVTAE